MLVVLRMVLKFVFVVAIFCHTVRPRRNFEQIREYACVVLHAQKSRKRSGGRHNHMVNHVDLSVFHLVVRTNYARERVYSGNYFSAVVCGKIYYYVSVRHGLLLQNTLLKVGGLIASMSPLSIMLLKTMTCASESLTLLTSKPRRFSTESTNS